MEWKRMNVINFQTPKKKKKNKGRIRWWSWKRRSRWGGFGDSTMPFIRLIFFVLYLSPQLRAGLRLPMRTGVMETWAFSPSSMPVDSIGLLALALMYMLLFIFLLIPRDIFHPTLGLGVVCLEKQQTKSRTTLGF